VVKVLKYRNGQVKKVLYFCGKENGSGGRMEDWKNREGWKIGRIRKDGRLEE